MLYSIQDAVEQKILLSVLTLKSKVKEMIVSCDAWFLVLMAVLLGLAFTIYAGMAVWCVVYKGKKFTGNWKWGKWYVNMYVECV